MKSNKTPYLAEYLKPLSERELEIRLEEELSKSTPDEEQIYAVLQELKRRKATPCRVTPEAAAAWHQFLQRKEKHTVAPRKPFGSTMRVAAVITVLILLFAVIPSVSGSENVFDLVAKWTDSFFTFDNPQKPIETKPPYRFETDHQGLQRIYDEVAALGASTPVIPSWVPDGYELTELKVVDNSGLCKVCAVMNNQDDLILIDLRIYYAQEKQTLYEKDDDELVILEIQDVPHYIMSNYDVYVATWMTNNMQCTITTSESKETLSNILHSIYK